MTRFGPSGASARASSADRRSRIRSAEPGDSAPDERPSMAAPASLVVSEVFGPTFQGEGRSLGRRCGFVRLGRCNLACTWCDTKYTWDWSQYDPSVELRRRTVDEVVADLAAMDVPMVVITGGEPLLQQRAMAALVQQCKERGWRV